jgi:menaquinone-dependent protoporphyrinogen oxidase
MNPRAIILYATREGQARRVAEHVGADLRAHGVAADLVDVRAVPDAIDWSAYGIVFVVASVHVGRHEREMRRFVTRWRRELEAASAAFLSITLSQAGVQDEHAPADRRAQARADVQRMIDVFTSETGWRPAHVLPVAGALAYTKYNWLVKLAIKRIARANGASTDTSRDWEFTDWSAVDRFVEQCAGFPSPA